MPRPTALCETFSAYTRQFLDLLPKPRVDSIENIRRRSPSSRPHRENLALHRGTMTELTDYFKVWSATSRNASTRKPARSGGRPTGRRSGKRRVPRFLRRLSSSPSRSPNRTILPGRKSLRSQDPVIRSRAGPRTVGDGPRADEEADVLVYRIDDLLADPALLAKAARVFVAQDRVSLTEDQRSRFLERGSCPPLRSRRGSHLL